ncbi:MAG: hypothetical protein U9R28_10525 [Pseudomonadota bacterium]|nr:hypothetical protein [Pseudomonadota bacterium]
MTDIKFSTGLFEQLGGNLYVTRPAYFEKNVFSKTAKPIEEGLKPQSSEAVDVLSNQATYEAADTGQSNPLDNEQTSELSVVKNQQTSVVFIGSGLNSIWEDESKLEWQLLQNICQAFDWSEDELSFFDTDSLISEDAIFTTMEEVIDQGVEWVLSMDSEHSITEQLSEGVQVIEVPDLEQMLSDPYAKQSFYQSVSQLLSSS